MNYQISTVGVGIILAYSTLVLLFIVWPLLKLFKSAWKWIVVGPLAITLLAAPWAEEYWIARNFYEACWDAGVHVVKRVEVEGFYDATGGGYDLVNRYGYQFAEYPQLYGGKIEHIDKTENGIKASALDRPSAKYHHQYAYHPTPYKTEERIGWKLEKLGTVIVDSETGEIIGRDTKYRRTINIAEGLWRLYWGLAKTTCEGSSPQPSDLRYPLYHYVLIPAKH